MYGVRYPSKILKSVQYFDIPMCQFTPASSQNEHFFSTQNMVTYQPVPLVEMGHILDFRNSAAYFYTTMALQVKMNSILHCLLTFQMLHQLTARAVIRDWEDGMLHKDRLEHEVNLYAEIKDT